MDRMAKATELLQEAARLGLRVEFHDGVNLLVKASASLDPEVIGQLTRYLPEIQTLVRRRAIGALANKYVGARIFSREHGAGSLVGASEDGALTILVGTEVRNSHEDESRVSQISITADVDSLLIVVDESAGSITDLDAAKPQTENRRMGVFEYLRRRSAGSDGGGI
jgi:hypothetical protein